MNNLNVIKTVKMQGNGYLLNNSLSIPNDSGNYYYKLIQDWISEGNTPEPEFTVEELENKKVQEERKKAKAERDKALNSITYTLSDGSVYQVRPQDVPNFQLAIQRNVDVDWILSDNTVRTTTVAELKEILDAGIQEGIKIWDEYTQKLKEIG